MVDCFLLHILADLGVFWGYSSMLVKNGLLIGQLIVAIPIVILCIACMGPWFSLDTYRTPLVYKWEIFIFFWIFAYVNFGRQATWQLYVFGCLGHLIKIYILRVMRLYGYADLRGRILNLGLWLGPCMLSFGTGFLVYELLKQTYRLLGAPKILGTIFGFIISIPMFLFVAFAKFLQWVRTLPETYNYLSDKIDKVIYGESRFEYGASTAYAWTKNLIMIAILLATCILMFFLIRGLVRWVKRFMATEHRKSKGLPVTRSWNLPTIHKTGSGSRRGLNNQEKIRAIYSDYLSFCRRNGVAVLSHTTTEEVLNERKQMDMDSPEYLLRQLYIAVRYQDAKKVTDEEVSLAKELFAKVKSQEHKSHQGE